MRVSRCVLLTVCYVFLFVSPAHASYVMPYPSYMPGHVLYTPRTIVDRIGEWWNFGEIGRAKYHNRLSDRYMVEAKTLFEYGQYKLAVSALKKSDLNFAQSLLYIREVEQRHKDNGELKAHLKEASKKHDEIIISLLSLLPKKAIWEEEYEEPETIEIAFLLRQSQIMRSYADTQ